jgi:glucose 1-dehydrogenase/3-oxoacyl-[acyl-carrier protein] reductase
LRESAREQDKADDLLTVQTDLTSDAATEEITKATRDRFGRIDILVNNAGIETIVPFLEMTDQQWNDVTMVNLCGSWMCSQVFCRCVTDARRQGAIVNIGSIQAARVLPGRTHYAPSKLAIEALTRNVSAEVSPLGIRVNCIHPGLIDTPMIEWLMNDSNLLPQVLGQISMGRPGQPVEIGAVAAFLASDEARYVTGQSFYVDGGWVGK